MLHKFGLNTNGESLASLCQRVLSFCGGAVEIKRETLRDLTILLARSFAAVAKHTRKDVISRERK